MFVGVEVKILDVRRFVETKMLMFQVKTKHNVFKFYWFKDDSI